ncbi:MAG: hypothetical protein H7Y09_15775 [Chitinophagaceae bacterium]|nr:hypothetical protein [Anaerolineae bacterium]
MAVLLGFFLLIARFYERFSGARTGFRLFTVVIVLFGAAVVRYAGIDSISSDALADAFLASGGILLLCLSMRLYWLMILRRRADLS